jgi:hypothetical protein
MQKSTAGKFHFLNLPSNHSITSSAATSRPGGTVNPSAFAVFKLSTVSYFIGAWTGRSVALEDVVDISRRLWKQFDIVGSIGHEAARRDERGEDKPRASGGGPPAR